MSHRGIFSKTHLPLSLFTALGLAMPRAPAPELVFWHRVSDCAPKGCGLLFSFLFLFYLFALSALACCSEVTVTSISLPPFVSRRGLSNTNQRLSLLVSSVIGLALGQVFGCPLQ